LKAACGERITGFELVGRIVFDMVIRHIPGSRDPLPQASPWYVLVELSDSTEGRVLDTFSRRRSAPRPRPASSQTPALAASESQRADFWKLRENVTEAQKLDGVSIKHDVSVPVSRVPELIERAGAALAAKFPDIRIVAFGHVGDGNIHYNCSKSERRTRRSSSRRRPR
jgi:FAD/FMN-containing dehydrogenase